MRKKGLGKGLAAIISEYSASGQNTLEEDLKFLMLDVNNIIPNPEQPRKTLDNAELAELVQSIKEHGVIQPVLVKKSKDNIYQLIAGHRRWNASKIAGLRSIPAMIQNKDNNLILALVENVQRSDLSPLEEAEAYKKLMEFGNYTHEEIANTLGKSRSHISNTMRLLKLPADIKEMIEKGTVSAGHARAILSSDDPVHLANEITKHKLSVREAENISKSSKDKEKKHAHKTGEEKKIEEMIAESLNANVCLKMKNEEEGELNISFKDSNKLDLLIQKLCN